MILYLWNLPEHEASKSINPVHDIFVNRSPFRIVVAVEGRIVDFGERVAVVFSAFLFSDDGAF